MEAEMEYNVKRPPSRKQKNKDATPVSMPATRGRRAQGARPYLPWARRWRTTADGRTEMRATPQQPSYLETTVRTQRVDIPCATPCNRNRSTMPSSPRSPRGVAH
eukprot:5433078-Pyramimonas_sp.AAC.1